MSNPAGKPLLLVVSAPSGGGKTTLCQQLLAANPRIARVITCTTRAPRAGEKEGVDYYFMEEAEFKRRVESGAFVEHATVFGHRYGTLKSELVGRLQNGQDVLLAIDVQGVATLRARAETDADLKQALVTVFLTPPSLQVLAQRLRKRGTDSAGVQQERLRQARQELLEWRHYDYLVISTTIAEDLRRTQAILEAEKMRQHRARPPALD